MMTNRIGIQSFPIFISYTFGTLMLEVSGPRFEANDHFALHIAFCILLSAFFLSLPPLTFNLQLFLSAFCLLCPLSKEPPGSEDQDEDQNDESENMSIHGRNIGGREIFDDP